jgi:hypothetical protein
MKNMPSFLAGFFASLIIIAAAGYFAFPHLLKAGLADINTEVKALDNRLQKAEAFIKNEEEMRVASHLSKDANVSQIVQKINATVTRLAALEDAVSKKESYFKIETAKAEESSKKASEKIMADMADLAKSVETEGKEIERLNQKIVLERNMMLVRSRLLRARMELSLRNLDTAKKELDLASDLFTSAGIDKNPSWKEPVEDIQASFRKAKGEIDLNLPAAIQRIDLLWNDLDRLSKS